MRSTITLALVELCEDQVRLIREQDAQIKEQQDKLADYEQELYDAWKKCLRIKQTSHLEEMA